MLNNKKKKMEIELKIRTDIYKGKGPKPVLIKRNVLQKFSTDTEGILGIKEIFTSKGEKDNKYCIVYIRDIGEIVVNHPYEEIKNLKNNKVNKIGFEYGKSKR